MTGNSQLCTTYVHNFINNPQSKKLKTYLTLAFISQRPQLIALAHSARLWAIARPMPITSLMPMDMILEGSPIKKAQRAQAPGLFLIPDALWPLGFDCYSKLFVVLLWHFFNSLAFFLCCILQTSSNRKTNAAIALITRTFTLSPTRKQSATLEHAHQQFEIRELSRHDQVRC